MFAFVEGVAADGRAGGAVTAGEADAVGGVFFEPVDDVAPCAHVEGFFLTPDPFLSGLGVAGDDLGEEVVVEGIELFDPDDRGVDVLFGAVLDEIVVDLAGAEDETIDALGLGFVGFVVEDFLEGGVAGEVGGGGDGFRETQHGLGSHDDERLPERPFELTAERVEVLGRGSEVTDLHVGLGAELEEAFESGAGVFRALAFVAVGEEERDAGGLLPFGFGGGDELVDDDLGTVHEVAELGFPEDEHFRGAETVAVVETEDGGFAEERVVDAEGGLSFREVLERHPAVAVFGIVEAGVALAEGTAADVLTGETHGGAFGEEGGEGEGFGVGPVEGTSVFGGLAAFVDDRAFDGGVEAEACGDVGEFDA